MFFQQPIFRWFQCISDENWLDKSFTCIGNYIQLGEPVNIDSFPQSNEDEFLFFGRSYDESIWFSDSDFQVLCSLARKGTAQLEQAAIKADTSYPSTDYSLIRKSICELCLASRTVITSPGNDYYDIKTSISSSVKDLLQNVKRLKQLPDYVLFNKHNENIHEDASYNYLHLALDMYWLSLTLEQYIEDDISVKLETFEKNLNAILADLIHVSVRKFEKINNYATLSKHNPFVCSCFKELWLLIQLYVEKLHSQQFCKDFWTYFNIAVKNEMNFQTCTNGPEAVACLWLLENIARLQGHDSEGFYIGPHHHRVVSNYSLIEQCLRIITNVNSSQIDEQLLCSCLHLLASLQMNWWKNDTTFDFLQLLWEYFYKKLNMSFSNEPGNFISNSQTSHDYSALTETILKYDLELSPISVTSYDIFLSLLGKYLTMNPSHWPKLKGRIYSKLPPPKLVALTDVGLHNLIQLFFVLAYTVNFNELTDKLQSLLNQLPASRSEDSSVIWSAHISLLLMKTNRGIALNGTNGSDICTPILLVVQTASADRSQAHLMRTFIEGLKKLIETDRELKCHTLFSGWINRYLQWCSHTDACFLLDILKTLIEKIQNLGGHPDWWAVMESNVVSSIIQLSSVVDTPPQIAGLAATLVSADGTRFKNVLEHMTGDTVNVSLSAKFLTSLLEQHMRSDLSFDHPTLLIQAWIRIAVLSTDKSELSELTSLIIHLPSWSYLCCDSLSEDDDPLYAVIRSAGQRLRDSNSVQDTAALKRWFETYFGRMDRWVGPVISAAEKGENVQLVMKVYTTAAVLYLHCAPALYAKNKNTCILYRLTSTLLLPSSVLVNKRPPNIILTALRRTWHLFVRGIARLDYKTDTYAQRTLKDIAIRYVPHMNDSTSPIIRCLDNEFEDSTTTFLLDKITNNIITCKSKNTHEHSLPALKLVLEMSRKHYDNVNKIEILIKTVVPSLYEQLMFTEDATAKNMVVMIIETMKTNHYYIQMRQIFKKSILIIVDKHLPFYSTNVFRLIELLANILPNEVENSFSNLTEAVTKVECMRGVGYDNTLRKGLLKVQEIIYQQPR